MPDTAAIRHFLGLGEVCLVDRWLRFAPAIDARYDDEQGAQRKAYLRFAIYLGLILYNVYNLTSIALLSDVLWLSIALRAGIVTPVSLSLVWLIGRTSPRWNERLVLAGVLNAHFIPVFLFWVTKDPLGLFTFSELSLTLVYANMLMALRFRYAVVFTVGALGATVLAVIAKADMGLSLRLAFIVQIVTAGIFSLYANYRTEWRRCEDYLVALDARLRAEAAEAARRQFQDLSRTDVLTELPNRRHLAERLDEWFAETRSIAVMMIDVDHFKLYNDALGHPAGDDCLRRVARMFADGAQAPDLFCARFGGEEFTFAVRGATELEAARLAKGLLQGIEALAIPHPARLDGSGIVTISIGIAMKWEGVDASQVDVFAAADRALYAAKSLGRNRFVIDEGAFSGLLDSA